MSDGISLEALLVLLFTVFAVPGACFLICLVQVVRGVFRGYRVRRSYRRYV